MKENIMNYQMKKQIFYREFGQDIIQGQKKKIVLKKNKLGLKVYQLIHVLIEIHL